jgi:hypothetical protein
MIQDSFKKMREIGDRLIEIERIRYRLRRENAPKETFQDLDKRHRAELALLKIHQRHFAIGIALAFFLVALGIFCGVIAMVCFRDGNLTSGLIATVCSISILYAGKKQILG